MLDDIVESLDYKILIENQIKEQLSFLLLKDQKFSIVLNVEKISFNPKLPKHIMDKINHFALFSLSNYTYSTINLDDSFLTFETGFGEENIGSILTVPYYSILQIIVEDKVIFINHTAAVDSFKSEKITRNSADVFKNNPKNKKFNS